MVGFVVVLLGGLAFAAFSTFKDTSSVGEPLALAAYAFLGWRYSIAWAWVLTLPAAMAIAGALYFVLRHLINRDFRWGTAGLPAGFRRPGRPDHSHQACR
jgi:hypothetical protein